MKIRIFKPETETLECGVNSQTDRLRRVSEKLGFEASVVPENYQHEANTAAIFLQAVDSQPGLRRAKAAGAKTVLILTGSDINVHLKGDEARKAEIFSTCDVIVCMHPLIKRKVPKQFQDQLHFIRQSFDDSAQPATARLTKAFSYVANIRRIKRPETVLRAADFLRDTDLEIVHAGGVWGEEYSCWPNYNGLPHAQNYRWLGGQTHAESLALIGSSRATIVASEAEGGSNVLSEAIVLGTPVITSNNECCVGLLGSNYPGIFDIGDSRGLSELIRRAAFDEDFYSDLVARTSELRSGFTFDTEVAAWREVFANMSIPKTADLTGPA